MASGAISKGAVAVVLDFFFLRFLDLFDWDDERCPASELEAAAPWPEPTAKTATCESIITVATKAARTDETRTDLSISFSP